MEPTPDNNPFAFPPALMTALEEEAEQQHRPIREVVRELVEKGLGPRWQKTPAWVQERAAALGLTEGGTPRRLARKVSEMSAAELEAIGNTEMDARHNHLDAELK